MVTPKPCVRQTSDPHKPASIRLSTPMIWLSVDLGFFI
jgi:hypothetical protein